MECGKEAGIAFLGFGGFCGEERLGGSCGFQFEERNEAPGNKQVFWRTFV